MQEVQRTQFETPSGCIIEGGKVDGFEISADEITEIMIGELYDFYLDFCDTWEEWFGWKKEPDNYKYSWHRMQARMTAQKHLLEHITDRLMIVAGMAEAFQIAEIVTLYKTATGRGDGACS